VPVFDPVAVDFQTEPLALDSAAVPEVDLEIANDPFIRR